MPTWTRGRLRVQQDHRSTLILIGGKALLIDAPAGALQLLGSASPASILITSGRLDRVAGLLELFVHHPSLELYLPLHDDRAALIGELVQQAWACSPTIDALGTGQPLLFGSSSVLFHSLPTADDQVSMGLSFDTPDARIAYVPRCLLDGAARRLVRGVDLVLCEPGAFTTEEALELSGPADLLFPTLAHA